MSGSICFIRAHVARCGQVDGHLHDDLDQAVVGHVEPGLVRLVARGVARVHPDDPPRPADDAKGHVVGGARHDRVPYRPAAQEFGQAAASEVCPRKEEENKEIK